MLSNPSAARTWPVRLANSATHKIEAALSAEWRIDDSSDPSRPRSHNQHARAEKDRFGNAVRYQHHGFPAFFSNAVEINVHLLSRYGIERAKRLVHQEN